MAEYERIRGDLLVSYGESAARQRGESDKTPWKITERAESLRRLQQEGCRTLLEIGAGTGQDSLYFAEAGLEVTATDQSPAMVARCQAKGLTARVMDFSEPVFAPGSFDAVHAMNCLLQVRRNAQQNHPVADHCNNQDTDKRVEDATGTAA